MYSGYVWISLSIYLPVCLSFCLFVCPSVYKYIGTVILRWELLQFCCYCFNPLLHRYSFLQINNRQLLKHCGKSRNCLYRVISPFPTKFSSESDSCIQVVHIFDISSLFAAKYKKPKIGISGKRLKFCRYMHHVLKLYKMQFSTIKDDLLLNKILAK